MTLVGYSISGADNDSYMYRTWKTAKRCPVCLAVLDHAALNPDFALERDVYDMSYTHDGACIVSEPAQRVFNAYPGVILTRLPHDRGFYLLNVRNVVAFDVERRKTRFEQFCDDCQRFRSVAGATPAFLRDERMPLSDGIYRTDVEFGSDDERHPVLIVSTAVRDKLRREAHKGVHFELVECDERR